MRRFVAIALLTASCHSVHAHGIARTALAIRIAVPESESQTHASRANHSCELPHDGQIELLKKTGMERNLTCSICMPVVTALLTGGASERNAADLLFDARAEQGGT
jgi:hypothetical protein